VKNLIDKCNSKVTYRYGPPGNTIVREAEAQPKKSTAFASLFLKIRNQIEQLYIQKIILIHLFTFCLITLFVSCQDIWKMPLIIHLACFICYFIMAKNVKTKVWLLY